MLQINVKKYSHLNYKTITNYTILLSFCCEVVISPWEKVDVKTAGTPFSFYLSRSSRAKVGKPFMFAQDQLHTGSSHKFYFIQCSINKALFTLLIKFRKQFDVMCSRQKQTT